MLMHLVQNTQPEDQKNRNECASQNDVQNGKAVGKFGIKLQANRKYELRTTKKIICICTICKYKTCAAKKGSLKKNKDTNKPITHVCSKDHRLYGIEYNLKKNPSTGKKSTNKVVRQKKIFQPSSNFEY